MELSDQEISILREIERDADLSISALSERVGVAQSTLWRKLNDLQATGVIRGKVALLDAAKVDAKLCVLALVTLEDHSEEAVTEFTRTVGLLPEIMECLKVTGVADYILKIRTSDVEAYDAFQTRYLLRSKWVRSVQSSFVLEEVKATTEVPL